ncbi:tetratricopeptide repeat protein [Hydrogenophaga sp. SL48]|uniref:tetratricopeptide repeat protein n=1 Tax=Hydrogenophaga sp. SL48 TaxID=2806347 RepID=UPI001F27E852|nr:tetratricopeptide repeat protein [Hydrogenophaga sp. SL48]UJW81302.1 sel1 repeat family protein [Hydrogenophaga sp. SL48]
MIKKGIKTPAKHLYDLALKAASRKHPDLARASALLEEAHDQGDRRATYAMATWYLFGNEVYPKNLRKAVQLLKLAAMADIASAHFDLAVSYETGQGIKKNEQAAYRHFLAAALNGDNESLTEVGRCLYYGIGIARDRKAAEVWFRRAEALGVDVR